MLLHLTKVCLNFHLLSLANHMKGSISLHVVDLEQQSCTMLYKGSDEEKRTHALWEHSHGSFIHEAMEEGMVDGRHLEVRNPFSFLGDTFSMSTPQLKEKLLLATDPRPPWFWKAMHEEEISWRYFIGGALQHIMKCKVLQKSEEALSFSHLDLHGFKEE